MATNSFATTGLPFTSDFETGDFSEWLGGGEASLTVTNADAFSGSYSARAVMTLGVPTDNYKDFYFGDHPNVNGTPPTNGLWLRFYHKISSGFNFGTTDWNKVAIINFADENGRRRYQLVINVGAGDQVYFVENLMWNADRSFGRGGGWPPNVGAPYPARLGQWDKIKMYFRPNTPGQSDGIVRLWINDTLTTEVTNASIRDNESFNPNVFIMSNYAPNTTIEGEQWWDNFYLGDTDPDSQNSDPAPNPPILLE